MYCRRIWSLSQFDSIDEQEAYSVSCNDNVRANVEKSFLKEQLEKVLNTLTERERRVIELRIYSEWTLSDIGLQLGITRERVRQIGAKALRKLRHPARANLIIEFYDINRDWNKNIDLEKSLFSLAITERSVNTNNSHREYNHRKLLQKIDLLYVVPPSKPKKIKLRPLIHRKPKTSKKLQEHQESEYNKTLTINKKLGLYGVQTIWGVQFKSNLPCPKEFTLHKNSDDKYFLGMPKDWVGYIPNIHYETYQRWLEELINDQNQQTKKA